MTLVNFINMGGYGVYVWSAYAMVAVVLLTNLGMSYWQYKLIFRKRVVSQKAESLATFVISGDSSLPMNFQQNKES